MAENYHKEVIAGLKDKSLFIQEAFIDGKWAARDNKFDVFEPSTATVLGIITPWSFPAAIITYKITPALAAGCFVIIKPPTEIPYSAFAFTKLTVDAGLPPATIQVILTCNHQAASELATNHLIKKISFTSSTGIGKYLTKLAANTLKKGAKTTISGSTPNSPGFFYQPTILTAIIKDKIFSPLAPIFKFKTKEDAICLANNTKFGLTGYFFSNDISHVICVAYKMHVDMVGANTGKISAAKAPFGGVKESSYRKEGSLYGITEY
ncbi:hypothetical protein NW763_008864 [Fusarium oxysporum]|nr:hypothetical protein NW763_008864 [Fusarium oxysporum]